MEDPSVTVLINTYNYGRFISRAIDSVLKQDYSAAPIEILVIDDGSTDDTARIVQDGYGSRVRYIRKENGGQASAQNTGFRAASGDIVCLLDSDDHFRPEKVRLVVEEFRRNPEVGMVFDEFDVVDGAGNRLGKRFPEPTWTGVRVPLRRVARNLRSMILLGHPWTSIMSLRRSVFQDLIIPEDLFPHSTDLFLGIMVPFLTEVAILEIPATYYVWHGGNVELLSASARNRAIYRRQMAFTRDYIQERFGVRFLTYLGRSVYDSDEAERPPLNRRATIYLRECRTIMAADVDARIKRRSQLKLAAALFPDPLYRALRGIRSAVRKRVRPGLRQPSSM